jgi:hypothetical protein
LVVAIFQDEKGRYLPLITEASLYGARTYSKYGRIFENMDCRLIPSRKYTFTRS